MADATRYVNLNLPIPLAEQIDKIVNNREFGYRSRNEFCMEAIRKKLRNFNYNGVGGSGNRNKQCLTCNPALSDQKTKRE